METTVEYAVAETVAAAFDYGLIDEGIRDEVKAAARTIHQLSAGVMTGIVAIGKRLIEVKGMIPHGQFVDWIVGEFQIEPRMAQNYMNVAREYGDPQKRNIISLFSPTVAYLLAAPSTPEEARVEVEQAALSGQKVTVELAKKAAAKFTEPKPTKPRAEVKRVAEPYQSPTPTPAKVTYLEPRVVVEVEEPATEPDPDELEAVAIVAAEQVEEKHWRARLDAIKNRMTELMAPDPRIARAREGMELITAGRAWVRDNHLDLTGKEVNTLAYWRDTSEMLGDLESLVDILTRKEVTK